MEPDRSVILLYGPTAVGKSDFALQLAETIGAEILSADSMQVYRGLDIGTAKPSKEERSRVCHHMIDVADPTEEFSVGNYCEQAWPIIDRAIERETPIIVCGGTGLYVKSLIDGLAEVPPPDPEFRRQMENLANEHGSGPLHDQLTRIDPVAASRIHPNDKKRIVRALEIHHLTGTSKTEFETHQTSPKWRDRVLWFGLVRDWKELDRRIDDRVDRMLDRGLIDEVRELLEKGCTSEHTAMKGLGYRETIAYLEGKETLERTRELIQRNTRRFARRQIGWFRKDRRMQWVEARDPISGSLCWEEFLSLKRVAPPHPG